MDLIAGSRALGARSFIRLVIFPRSSDGDPTHTFKRVGGVRLSCV